MARRQTPEQMIQRGLKSSLIGIGVNFVLALLKCTTGLIGHSFALIADGIESLSDVISSSVVYVGLRLSIKPPDEDHPYGHGRSETIAGLAVPKGDYTLYVKVKDPDAWELVINKQTGQWGTNYDALQDLGRVKMDMRKPAAPVEELKYTITSTGGNKGTIQLAWEKHIASVGVMAK